MKQQPKKILFVIESLAIGGAEKSLVNLLNTLDFTGWQVDLLLTAREGLLEKEVPEFVNIKTAQRSFPALARAKFLIKRKLRNHVQTEDLFWQTFGRHIPQLDGEYDVAVGYSQGFATYFVAEKVKAAKKVAWVNTDYEKAGYNADFDVNFYQKFDGIVAASAAGSEIFRKVFGSKNLKVPVHTIEDLLGEQKIVEKSKEPVNLDDYSGLKLVSVGRLHPAKGFNLAIEAAEILKTNGLDFRWWIIGEGAERPLLENFNKRKNLCKITLVFSRSRC